MRKVTLFDLGGVLVETCGNATLARLLPHLPEPEVLPRWQQSRAVNLFERGQISAEEFVSTFPLEWALPLEGEQFLESFRTWVTGPFDGAAELLRELGRKHHVACLSNTNAIHWDDLQALHPLFETPLVSHRLGRMKPEPEIFEQAIAALGVPASAIYFFDDLDSNVKAAQRAGMQAFQVRGIAETREALRTAGLHD